MVPPSDTRATQHVLISVSGPDRPGITAALTAVIAEAGLEIQDMEQGVVRGLLSLSMLLEFPGGEAGGTPVLKDLLFAAKKLDVELDFKVVRPEENGGGERSKSVLTLIGRGPISAGALARVTGVLAEKGFNIETIRRLDQARIRCLEMVVSSEDPRGPRMLKNELLPVGREFGVDIALQPDNFFRRVKRLVVFDLDSTLIQAEIIDDLAAAAGVGPQVAALTTRAMAGELDFRQALRERVALLQGLSERKLEQVYNNLPITPGAEALIQALKRMGYRTAIISGGFTFFADRIRVRLGLDHAFANRLEISGGLLTGRLHDPVIDGEGKAALLEKIAEQEGIHVDQAIAIGDGANDLPMLKKAGLGVAFNANPSVREAAEHSLTQSSLDSILFLLGISQRDLDGLRHHP